jgi:ketosteroid isomerase-like protein
MRRLSIGSALTVMVLAIAACTGSSKDTAAQQELQEKADRWEIDQIEKKFHKATTKQDIDLMMSLWAPNATLTVGPADTAAGTDEIKEFWLEKSATFDMQNHWISDHPAYKVEITVDGDRGTLHFECHYVDLETGAMAFVTTADLDVGRIAGDWLITNMVAGSTTLAA